MPRWTLLVLVAILVLGAGLRLLYLRDLKSDPLFVRPALDAELHDYWARALATGDWTVPTHRHDPEIRTTPYFRPPGSGRASARPPSNQPSRAARYARL